METLIHCHHCQEDMNIADWEASRGACPHCGQDAEPEWSPLQFRRRNPFFRVRQRLEIQPFLRSQPVYV